MVPEGTPALEEFLADQRRQNKWLHANKMEVYVRRGRHVLGDTVHKCLDVANISVHPEHQNMGIFRLWLKYAEQCAAQSGLDAVFVECVMTRRLACFLEKEDYRPKEDDSQSWYKLVQPL